MKQSQKNYLIQRLTGVYNEKRNAIAQTGPKEVTEAEIRAIVRASGLKLATQAEFVDEIVLNKGQVPDRLTRWSSGADILVKNRKEYNELLQAKTSAFYEEQKKKQAELLKIYTNAKDKVMLGDDAPGALAILKELQAFEV